jgi:hypothetical protein
MVAGRRVIGALRHAQRERIARRFEAAMQGLWSDA